MISMADFDEKFILHVTSGHKNRQKGDNGMLNITPVIKCWFSSKN